MQSTEMAPGDRLGKYELVMELDRDPVCSIWAAVWQREDMAQAVRIARLREPCSSRPALRGAFLRDARIAARVSNPQVVGVRETVGSGDEAYIALELVDAVTLAELLDSAERLRQPIPMPALMRIAIEVADALAAMHCTPAADRGPAIGVAHGDLTPGTILIRPDASVLVVPTALGRVGCHPTAPRSIERLRYKAPEQLADPSLTRELDPKVDVFSFGAVLWEAFTGRPAFEGSSAGQVAAAVAEAAVPPLVEQIDSSHGLSYVLERALQRDPTERFGDAVELANALRVLRRRLERGLTAKRNYFQLARSGVADAGQQALFECFQRLVGPEYTARRAELEFLLPARLKP